MANEPKVIPVDTPEGKYLNRIHDLARHVRGSFMEQAIWIDVLVADILAQYFAPDEDKRALLISEVLTGQGSTFSRNINTLRKVVSRSYASFSEEYPDFFSQLEKIRKFRNRLAHAHLDTSDKFIAEGHEDRIRIVFYEDGIAKTQVITVEDSNKRLGESSAVLSQLLKLQALVTAASTT